MPAPAHQAASLRLANDAAIDLLHAGRTSEAAAGFRAALVVQPDGPEAYYNLGIAYKDQGRHYDSMVAYNAALALRPTFPEASFNAGRALQMITDDPGPLGLLRPGQHWRVCDKSEKLSWHRHSLAILDEFLALTHPGQQRGM